MNIYFERIKWKNFLSYGNEFTELNFSSGIDLVIGTNGQGKSTFNDAVFYALFGRAFRKVKTGSLVNRTNKKRLAVEIEFKVDEKRYKIYRSIKPNKFEIYIEANDKDGSTGEFTLIEQRASVKDYQKFLEEEILNLNETIFRQLIVLGANLPSSKPFMELSQQEKESLFQVLTDTSIFGHIKNSIKTRMLDKKQSLKEYSYKRDILKSSLDSERLMINQAEKQNEEFKSQHKNNLTLTQESIDITKVNIGRYKDALVKLKELKVVYDEDIIKLSHLQKTLNESIENNKENINSSRDKILSDYNSALEQFDEEYKNISYSNIEQEISNLEEKSLSYLKEINNYENKIAIINAAEKSAISCSDCSAINYIVDVSKEEVANKKKYISAINDINNNKEDLNNNINNIKRELLLKREKDILNTKTKKEGAFKLKLKEEAIVKELNDNFMGGISDKSTEINLIIDKTSNYKEKLLNGKRLKETLKEQETNLDYYENKLVELNSIKLVELNYDSLNKKEADMEDILAFTKELVADSDNLNYLENLIGANNLKGAVIKKQIPLLNKGINHFLELFSMLEYSFVIDENFKERLISRDEDSEFNQLSNGQKARISFSIMFAFLKLIEERNGVKTNLLVLDEILDSSVDASGREELLNILKSEFSETKNIIIISHNPEIKEKIELFDRLIHINKDKFSTLTIENL